MARISGTEGPSSSDVAKETALLVKQGKIHPNGKVNEWNGWKVS